MQNRTGITSDIHINMNKVHSNEEISLYIEMVKDLLMEKEINHFIINGDISWLKEQIDFFRDEAVRQLGPDIQFHYTNGNHDISEENGISVGEYIKGDTDERHHLKNSPIIDGNSVILGMDTLYDYSYYNIDLLEENRATSEVLEQLMDLTDKRISEDTFYDWKEVAGLSDKCIQAAEEKIRRYPGKDIYFLTHYMPKEEFVSRNQEQDMHLAKKNAMMGTSKIGEMLERNGVKMCFFGHTHRRISGKYGETSYICQPVGTEEDWIKFSKEQHIGGMKLFTKKEPAFVEALIQQYQPTEAVLNLFLQTEETLQIIESTSCVQENDDKKVEEKVR